MSHVRWLEWSSLLCVNIMAALEHFRWIFMNESHAHTFDYVLFMFPIVNIFPLLSRSLVWGFSSMAPQDLLYEILILDLEMLNIKDECWRLWSLKSGWGYRRWGTECRSCWCSRWAHAVSMEMVWSVSVWLSGLHSTWWQRGQVLPMTKGGGGELERGRSGGCLHHRQWLVPLHASLSPPLTLPSTDPKSCFDWISHELMRQAWRTATVPKISYHILICSLCKWRVCLFDLMEFFKIFVIKWDLNRACLMGVCFNTLNDSGFILYNINWILKLAGAG